MYPLFKSTLIYEILVILTMNKTGEKNINFNLKKQGFLVDRGRTKIKFIQ
jgi:hypothetical protein